MNLGWTEIILIAAVGLLLFGPSKLPQLGKSMGQAIRGFKKGIADDADDSEKEVNEKLAHNPEKPLNQTQKEKSEQKES
jgi:sec-independent protein translocase protein TatA